MSDTCIALSNLSICYTLKYMKKHTKMINLKYQLWHGIQGLNYLMGHNLYQIFNIVLNISLKDHEAVADNLETEDKINITLLIN